MLAAAPMEAQTTQTPLDPSSATATYPRWVMFDQHLKIVSEGSSCSKSSDASKTSVAGHTSTGLPIQVSLRLAEPPAVSCVCLQIPAGFEGKDSEVLAAHGDSMLIKVSIEGGEHDYTTDNFIYNAGDAAADPPRPPSLSLLPPFNLGYHGTGLVRRGEDELVVAHLKTVSSPRSEPDAPELMIRVADLSLFRGGEWSVRHLQIRIHDASEFRELPTFWNAVVPVSDGLLCWIDLGKLGIVLCDVFEETPKLQYLPLPRDNICGLPSNRNVCSTCGGNALKFVNVFPRCCCGGAGASYCERSRHAYTIHTWTMRIGNVDDMRWVKDSSFDATELWALDSYKGLRCFPLDHPIMSIDHPDLICFWLHEPPVDGYWEYRDESVDLLMVNIRSKTIHSVSRNKDWLLQMRDHHLIPSNVSYFFNSYPSSSSIDGALTGRRKNKGIVRPPVTIIDEDEQLISKRLRATITTKPTLQPPSMAEPSVQASEIFEAFQEIPSYGLDHVEIIKAYSILSRDNCRLFRSLIRLPKNVRKDWLIMEVMSNRE